MTCFNHSDQSAQGVCKQCGRLLCKSCIAQELDSVSCKNRCEEKVKAMDAAIQKSIISKYSTSMISSFLVFFMLAALSAMIYQIPDFEIFGIIFGILALVSLFNALRVWLQKS